MAQCKDCIHGEVCDTFVHTRTLICNDKADKMCKMFKSTADVVAKNKYDLAVAEREANVKGFAEDLAKAKAEAERETFAELNRAISAIYENYVFDNRDIEGIEQDAIIAFAEAVQKGCADLKKKYTENME